MKIYAKNSPQMTSTTILRSLRNDPKKSMDHKMVKGKTNKMRTMDKITIMKMERKRKTVRWNSES